jgi:hypothetical protein
VTITTDRQGKAVRITRTSTLHVSEHLQQVEALLDPIRYDRSIDDAERRRLISEALATANARALSLRAARHQPVEAAHNPIWKAS